VADEFDVDLGGDEVPTVGASDDPLAAEKRRRLEVAPPLEEYVAFQVKVTKAQIAAGRVGSHAVDDPEGRVARTERYARLRWNGWVACEIDSL